MELSKDAHSSWAVDYTRLQWLLKQFLLKTSKLSEVNHVSLAYWQVWLWIRTKTDGANVCWYHEITRTWLDSRGFSLKKCILLTKYLPSGENLHRWCDCLNSSEKFMSSVLRRPDFAEYSSKQTNEVLQVTTCESRHFEKGAKIPLVVIWITRWLSCLWKLMWLYLNNVIKLS